LKGISTIFSTLIVTIIILSFFVPLLIYYSSISQQNEGIILSLINQGKESLEVKITLIRLGNSTNQIYVYNYGETSVNIYQIILNNVTYSVNYTLQPNSLLKLSNIIGNITISINQIIIMKINNNYYVFK